MRLLMALSCLLLLAGMRPAFGQDMSLAEAVGFSDAHLEAVEAQGQNTLGESVEFAAYDHTYRLLAIWGNTGEAGTTLLYQTDSAVPTFLWSRDYGALHGQKPHINSDHALFAAPAPGDWDGSGVVEFAVMGTSNSPVKALASMFYVYGLNADGTVIPRLTDAIPAGEVVTRITSVSEGLYYLTVADLRGMNTMTLPDCCFPQFQRTFVWSGDTASDISGQGAPNYSSEMGRLLLALTTLDRYPPEDGVDPTADYAARLLELLMTYEVAGQREAGLKVVQALVDLRKSEQYLPENSYIDDVFLPAMNWFFENDQPFLPPEYASSTPPQPINFYTEPSTE